MSPNLSVKSSLSILRKGCSTLCLPVA